MGIAARDIIFVDGKPMLKGDKPKRKNKYNAKKCMLDGRSFDSKAEMKRYRELKYMVRDGIILDLKFQPKFRLVVNGVDVCGYTADFEYTLVSTGATVIEDVKSEGTKKARDYPIKIKLMKACHNIDVNEVIR